MFSKILEVLLGREGYKEVILNFDKKVSLITGAGSGIGRQLAIELEKLGSIVVLSDVNESGLEETAKLVNCEDKERFSVVDVTNYDQVKSFIQKATQKFGRIDYLFNNAGIAIAADARDYDVSHWKAVVDVNLMGVIHGCDVAYKIMAKQGSGHIVNIASLSGLVPFPTNAPYAATKHAVVGLSTSLRVEGEALGVKVSAVCPGFIESNIYSATKSINLDRESFLNADLPFKKVPTDIAAGEILKGVFKNKSLIVFPGYAIVAWFLYRVSSFFQRKISRDLISQFRRMRQS